MPVSSGTATYVPTSRPTGSSSARRRRGASASGPRPPLVPVAPVAPGSRHPRPPGLRVAVVQEPLLLPLQHVLLRQGVVLRPGTQGDVVPARLLVVHLRPVVHRVGLLRLRPPGALFVVVVVVGLVHSLLPVEVVQFHPGRSGLAVPPAGPVGRVFQGAPPTAPWVDVTYFNPCPNPRGASPRSASHNCGRYATVRRHASRLLWTVTTLRVSSSSFSGRPVSSAATRCAPGCAPPVPRI